MKRFVLDCSVTMAWCFDDETTTYTDLILDNLQAYTAVVPSLWPLEVANVLVGAERKRRITNAKALHFLQLLQTLPIDIDPLTARQSFGATYHLATQYEISVYDAAYLELAVRHQVPLATCDQALRRAAQQCGIATQLA